MARPKEVVRRRLTIEEIPIGSSSGDEARVTRDDPDAAGSSEEATPERGAPSAAAPSRRGDDSEASESAEDEAEDEGEDATGTEGTPGRGPRKSRVSLPTLFFNKNPIFSIFFH